MRINCGVYIEDKVSFTTYKFDKKLYLGCPMNSIYHFDQFEYDEILIVNNSRFVDSFEMIYLKSLSESSWKPKCYAGGIKLLSQAKSIIEIGFERISIRDLFFENRIEYSNILKFLGRQGVTLCLDIKKEDNNYFIQYLGRSVISLEKFDLEDELLPGELLINNIDLNGTLMGPDLELLDLIKKKKIKTNINYCGGVRDLNDIDTLKRFGVNATTIFTASSTILNGSQKLINNSFSR